MNTLQDSNLSAQFLTDLKSSPTPHRTHCRICEARLKQADDPVWGLCADCLEQKRAFWQSTYDRIEDNEPVATGVIQRPNRLA